MFRSILLIYFCCLFYITNGCAQVSYSNKPLYNEASLLRHVKSLSSDAFEGRRTGTKGAAKARNYIVNQFHTLKVNPLCEAFKQPFLFINKRKAFDAVNILGLIKGTEFSNKYIVISAHYDHEGIKSGEIYNGADDNASGISALFSFAEHFRKYPPKHSVILAAFDGEELGLQGSKYFVNSHVVSTKNIVANLNMDMISRSDKSELFAVGTPHNKHFEYIITHLKCSNKIKLKIGHDGYDGLDDWTYSSDHANFYKKGIPFYILELKIIKIIMNQQTIMKILILSFILKQ